MFKVLARERQEGFELVQNKTLQKKNIFSNNILAGEHVPEYNPYATFRRRRQSASRTAKWRPEPSMNPGSIYRK